MGQAMAGNLLKAGNTFMSGTGQPRDNQGRPGSENPMKSRQDK
jgi:hypothetical protein